MATIPTSKAATSDGSRYADPFATETPLRSTIRPRRTTISAGIVEMLSVTMGSTEMEIMCRILANVDAGSLSAVENSTLEDFLNVVRELQ